MNTPIRNVFELQTEIGRLRNLELQQGVALKARFSGPVATFSTLMTVFPKSAATEGSQAAGLFHQDFLGILSRFVLPLALNKTLFRKSNFIVKTLVGILSQKASHYISEDSVGGVWSTVKGLIGKFTKKKEDEPVTPSFTKYTKPEVLG